MQQAGLGSVFIFNSYMFHQMFHHMLYPLFHSMLLPQILLIDSPPVSFIVSLDDVFPSIYHLSYAGLVTSFRYIYLWMNGI
jgi:hypothetical protein